MTQQIINIGISANDRTGDPIRNAFNKVNQNFSELYSLSGGSITTGNITFDNSTLRGPEGYIDGFKVRIQPSTSFENTLAVYPTADGDIHLLEDSLLKGGITLGDYGKSNISVWGNGGTNPTVDDIELITVNNGIINLQTDGGIINLQTDGGNKNWTFDITGTFSTPRDQLYGGAIIDPSHTTRILSSMSTPTSIWTSSNSSVYSVKATVSVFFGTSNSIDSQTCEMLIARREYYDGITWSYSAIATVYGVIHTTIEPIAALDVKCNTNGFIQITAMKDLGMTGVDYFVQVVAQEIYKD